MHRYTSRAHLAMVAALVLVCTGITAGPGAATIEPQPHCGSVLTHSIVLTRDLTGCPDNGLVIGADNVTLDLHGHTVGGDGTLQDQCPGDQPCDVGIDNSAGHTHLTVRGGSVRDFALGVLLVGADHNDLRQLSVTRSFFGGIIVVNSSGTRVMSSTVADNGLTTDGAGIFLFTSRDSRIRSNRLTGNGDAGLVALSQSDNNTIADNTVADNTNAGIVVDGTGNEVRRNGVARNGDGIIVTGDGNRIRRNQVVDAVGCLDGGCGFGISLEGGSGNTVADNDVLRAQKVGIRVDAFTGPATGTVIRGNRVEDAGVHDIAVDFEHVGPVTHTLVLANVAIRAGDDGIHVDSAATTVTRNIAEHNTDLGIDAVPGVTDGGGNHASGNGNPLECVNITCRP
jgi:parallel beta-helix repeat protein